MKSIKRIFINLMATLLVVGACFGLTACKKDIREMVITISVYNYEDNVTEEVTLKVDLYGHLAPKTVDAINEYVNDGYYNNTAIYKLTDGSFGFMVGDIKIENDELKPNAVKPEIKGEFEKGGTVGSNLVAKKGSIGLFRSWYAEYDKTYSVNDFAMHSGRATWFMPTADSEISSYTGWFCIFAQFDLEDEDNAYALDLITKAFDNETESYTVYYEGEYDENKADEDYGLEKHIVLATDFEGGDNVFVAGDNQLACYNEQTIKVPTKDGEFALKIVKAEVK